VRTFTKIVNVALKALLTPLTEELNSWVGKGVEHTMNSEV
jgi:hypothetical protein